MRRAKSFIGAFAAISVLFLMVAPMVSAQELLGEWYKLNCQVIARQINPDTGVVTNYNRTFTAYYYFGDFFYDGDWRYEYEVWVKGYSGYWQHCFSGICMASDLSDRFLIDQFVLFDDGASYLYTYSSPYINENHTYFWAMGEVFMGENYLGNEVHGGIIITGSKVTSLPFDPTDSAPPVLLSAPDQNPRPTHGR